MEASLYVPCALPAKHCAFCAQQYELCMGVLYVPHLYIYMYKLYMYVYIHVQYIQVLYIHILYIYMYMYMDSADVHRDSLGGGGEFHVNELFVSGYQ